MEKTCVVLVIETELGTHLCVTETEQIAMEIAYNWVRDEWDYEIHGELPDDYNKATLQFFNAEEYKALYVFHIPILDYVAPEALESL
jgi:hypothetical protein